ncbi:MAG: transcription termination/antitermination protein NusG [Thermoplasmata archaeon]|jgi:transcriptional antiterminator NusG|nr:transcription termination/antitermination protein NusG [Thermoplasmata archaeon]
MQDEGDLGILPTKEELAQKAQAKPTATPAVTQDNPAEPKDAKTPRRKKAKRAEIADTEPEALTGSQILVLKTQVGQERRVAEALGNKARRFKLPISAILSPAELRGFVFLETSNPLEAEKGIRGVSYARALVTRQEEVRDENGNIARDRRGKVVTRKIPVDIPFSEIAHFLTPVSAVAKIAEGDIVELVSGPFRGEKAKVTRVDDTKEEITVELIESMVPIPITVKGEHVRVLEKSQH